MTFAGFCLSMFVLWSTSSHIYSFTHEGLQPEARIKITHKDMVFTTLKLPNTQSGGVLTLVKEPHGSAVYAGSPRGLYLVKADSGQLTQIHVPLFGTDCGNSSSPCEYSISLLKEGTNEYPLFICGERNDIKKCCYVSSEQDPVDCFNMGNRPHIDEPSLHIGDTLFFTLSGRSNADASIGLYRQTKDSYTWPLSSKEEQRNVKIVADKGSRSPRGKVYSFYMEKNANKDPETLVWIPRVAQFCMADEGGLKNQLQYRWTSMLTARLYCGDEEKKTSFTELLDVAVLEEKEWSGSTIYALFRNAYNLSAICIYKMDTISHTFTNSTFKKDELPVPGSPRPGECVPGKNFTPSFLRFMQTRPEMEAWVKPTRGPMLIRRHNHYTRLQVERVESLGSVLLIALENGRVHKVLEQDGEAFIIAEYQPFTSKTRVQSLLLDSSAKLLYVSSSSEVVRVDLAHCSVYGSQCCLCVQARDPHCDWSQSSASCSPADKHPGDDLSRDCAACAESSAAVASPHQSSSTAGAVTVLQGSPAYLSCPVISRHASYAWLHGEQKSDCVFAGHVCLLLIDSMSEDRQGIYQCVASENGHETVVASHTLLLNRTPWPRATPLVTACLLLLLSVIC